jgi:branched-chain amino acid transport system permease protein
MTSKEMTVQQTAPTQTWLKKNLAGLLITAALAVFPFVFSLISGVPVNEGVSKFWQGQLIAFFIMAVYAMSYDLLIGYTGILTFGHAAFFGGGAYAMALFLTHVGPKISANYLITLPGGADITSVVIFIMAVLLVIVVSMLLGLLFSATSVRLKGVYFAMLTLAIGNAFHILSKATDFVKWTGADEGLHGVPVPLWLNPTQNRLTMYFVSLGFLVLMYIFMKRVTESPTGRVFVALRENESRVRMIGFNPAIYRTAAFLVAAVVAGLAGGLWSVWNMSATPSMTSATTTINALIMTILGGIGTLVGPILGAGLMQIVGQFFYTWFGPRWPLVFGLLFILIVIFLPYGVVGTWRQKAPLAKEGWKRLVKTLNTKED